MATPINPNQIVGPASKGPTDLPVQDGEVQTQQVKQAASAPGGPLGGLTNMVPRSALNGLIVGGALLLVTGRQMNARNLLTFAGTGAAVLWAKESLLGIDLF